MSRHNSLLRWRQNALRCLTPSALVESLSVEGLPYDEIPEEMAERVTAFRHLSRRARVAVCTTYFHQIGWPPMTDRGTPIERLAATATPHERMQGLFYANEWRYRTKTADGLDELRRMAASGNVAAAVAVCQLTQ